MKRILSVLIAFVLSVMAEAVLTGCVEGSEKPAESETASVESADVVSKEENNSLGEYDVEIKSCRLSKDYEGKDVAIITYGFTNKSDSTESFMFAVFDEVFQGGISLEQSFFLEDESISLGNQDKNIKPGATLDVDIAYELKDLTSDIEVEVCEIISLIERRITKTFKIEE